MNWLGKVQPRRGALSLAAMLAISGAALIELWALAGQAVAEQRAISISWALVRADYAAQGAIDVAAAMIARGKNPNGMGGRLEGAMWTITARREGRSWIVTATGQSEAGLGCVVSQRILARITHAGHITSWRYLQPLQPQPAGRT